MNRIIPMLLVILLTACGQSSKNELKVRSNDKGQTLLNDGKLTAIEEIDTIKGVVESYKVDEDGLRQGQTTVLTTAGDTLLRWECINDTVLSYLFKYDNNSLIERQEVIYYPENREFTLQGYLKLTETGKIDTMSSCYIDWNYDISTELEYNKNTISIIGVVRCPVLETVGYNCYLIRNTDTLVEYYTKNDTLAFNDISLVNGLNSIKLCIDTFEKNNSDTLLKPREYQLFINRLM